SSQVDNYATEIERRTVADAPAAIFQRGLGEYLLSEALLAGVTPYNAYRLLPPLPSTPPFTPSLMRDRVIQHSAALTEKEASLGMLRAVAFAEAGQLQPARDELQRVLAVSLGPERSKGQARIPIDRKAHDMAHMYLEWLQSK